MTRTMSQASSATSYAAQHSEGLHVHEELPMPEFDLTDVAGKEFLLPMLLRAYAELEKTLRDVDTDGGPRVAYLLAIAAEGMKRTAKQLAALCNTEAAARMANAERALYESGLISAGISPVTVTVPRQYRD